MAHLQATLRAWQSRVREPALTALLLGQLTFLFLLNPLLSMRLVPLTVLDGAHALLLSISYFVLPQGSRLRALLVLCLLPLLWELVAGNSRLLGLLLAMLATLLITVAVASTVFRAQRVTLHQLLGAVVVYLNIPLLFMGAFMALHAVAGEALATTTGQPAHPSDIQYFSLTTVTSTGYGDILPVHPLARSLANLEAVAGRLYLGILLARLVSQHTARPPAPGGDK